MRNCYKYLAALFLGIFIVSPSAHAAEITAIDFNGDLIGKVISDGKVVSYDNQLIGNITADSFIVNFDGKLIGGVVPQGIAIGNDNKLLGKVNNDGSVRLASGKIIGKVLPEGLVVDDYFQVIGAVLFPGLVYSDEGTTVGRLTGDGAYTDLSGQTIGFISADGYAYRRSGRDYLLEGRLISSKMVVSPEGNFIGSIAPGGEVTDFDGKTIGFIRANGLAYNESAQVIGRLVRPGYAFDDKGAYLGFVTYNGEVKQQDKTIGRLLIDGRVADLEGNVIGYALDAASTFSDNNGKYLGRLSPDGNVVLARESVGRIGPRGTVLDKDNRVIGRLISGGPVFDYRGSLVAHALKNGSVITLEGSSLGYIISDRAFDNNGRQLGGTFGYNQVFNLNNQPLGIVGINGTVMDKEEKNQASPLGYVYSADGSAAGRLLNGTDVFGLNGGTEAFIAPNGNLSAGGAEKTGTMTQSGIALNPDGSIMGGLVDSGEAVDENGNSLGILADGNRLLDSQLDMSAKILPDFSVVAASEPNSPEFSPVLGRLLQYGLALDIKGTLLGYVFENGSVHDLSGKNIGKATSLGSVIDNNGSLRGRIIGYGNVVSDSCQLLGGVDGSGEVRNFRDVKQGNILLNGQVFDVNDNIVGHQIIPGTVINFSDRIAGTVSADGHALSPDNKDIGCLSPRGMLFSAEGALLGRRLDYFPVMNYNDKIIGRPVLDGRIVNNNNQFIGRILPDDNAVSDSASPIGRLFRYQYAFDNRNRYLGRITSSAEVIDDQGNKQGRVTLDGYVVSPEGSNIGYALYDLYVYDNDFKTSGYIAKDGNVLSLSGRRLGKIDRGFLVDKNSQVMARGNRDFFIRNDSNEILGELLLNGDLRRHDGQIIGRLGKDGNIFNADGELIGIAKPLQYYNVTIDREKVYDANGNVIGYLAGDGNVYDENGKLIGRVTSSGIVVDENGNVIGNVGDAAALVRDADGNIIGYVDKDGNIRSADGRIIGKAGQSVNVVRDANGNIIGYVDEDGNVRGFDGVIVGKLGEDGRVYDENGNVIGTVAEKQQLVFDENGNVIGTVAEKQQLAFDENGRIIGTVDKEHRLARDDNGNVIGYVDDNGNVVDFEGKNIGKIDVEGIALGPDGSIIGGIGRNWYERVDLTKVDKKLPDVGIYNKDGKDTPLKLDKDYRKSLNIALTPDGEYLGEIMEDGRVIDKNGNYVGRRMPDGLIIDDDGTLIGIEETQAPRSGEMFVPAGTFGPGAAYGIGSGPGGNLGPGGGFGSGERYDPQRVAALAAAQNVRRQSMGVGHVSTNVKTESFDGYQKNWDNEGVAKTISSWRVDMSEMILADKPIPAVISRSIDSNNPTPVTAYVERNVYSEEGRNVIIPAGSRLMGSLNGMTASTEGTTSSARVQISWDRLIRPDGVLFTFQGITADAMGRGGALGYLDQQLFKKYTLPIMTTVLSSAASYVMAPSEDSDSSVETPRQQAASDARDNFLSQMNEIFGQILSDKTNIRPLTYVPAGTRIIVFPNVDLWLRTPERDDEDSSNNRRNLFIDDQETQGRINAEQAQQNVVSSGSGVDASGNVVYETTGSNAPVASSTPKLIADKPSANAGTSAAGAVPPPPPVSTSATPVAPASSSGSSSRGSSSSTGDSSVPQLF